MMVTKFEVLGLDWKAILGRAIERRPRSWGDYPVREWRNASDEVGLAVLAAMVEAGLVEEDV